MKKDIVVIIIDVDGLKRINDCYGHCVGDEAIVVVAQSLKAVSREADLVARIGGDEFVVAMPLNRQNEVELYLERLQQQLATSPLINGEYLTVSAGYHTKAFTELESFNLADFLVEADKHLYAMKTNH